MKIPKVTTLLLFVVLITGSCSSTRPTAGTNAEIMPLSQNAKIEDGSLVYGLPLTVFDITIETERVVQRPGPYAAYAEDLLGLKDVIRSENVRWTVKGITVRTHEELDPSQFYIISASSLLQLNALSLKREGLILDLNPEIYDREAGLTGLNTADNSAHHIYDFGSDEYFQSRRDTLYKLLNVDTAFIRIPYLVEKKQKLSLDQLAEKAATRLMELRDGKHMILTGEANVFPQNDAAINEINRLEKEHLELFAGKSWRERRSFTYQVIPGKDMAGKKVTVCGFSEKTGPVKPGGTDGLPIQVEFVPENKTKELTRLTSQAKQLPNRIYYRVPEVVNIRISFGDEQVSSARKLVYQLGETVQLPANYIIGK